VHAGRDLAVAVDSQTLEMALSFLVAPASAFTDRIESAGLSFGDHAHLVWLRRLYGRSPVIEARMRFLFRRRRRGLWMRRRHRLQCWGWCSGDRGSSPRYLLFDFSRQRLRRI